MVTQMAEVLKDECLRKHLTLLDAAGGEGLSLIAGALCGLNGDERVYSWRGVSECVGKEYFSYVLELAEFVQRSR